MSRLDHFIARLDRVRRSRNGYEKTGGLHDVKGASEIADFKPNSFTFTEKRT